MKANPSKVGMVKSDPIEVAYSVAVEPATSQAAGKPQTFDAPGSASNPLAVTDDAPSEPAQPNGAPESSSTPLTKENLDLHTKNEEGTLKVITPSGAEVQGNLEFKFSSSDQVLPSLPKSGAENIVEKMSEANKKHANVVTRAFWTFVMIGGFICMFDRVVIFCTTDFLC